MALLDDSRQAMNDSIATNDNAELPVTSTPARQDTSSSASSASSHPSMPPLESSSTQDSGHSSASDTSDTVFTNQPVTQNFEKDLLKLLILFINARINRKSPRWNPAWSEAIQTSAQRLPGMKECSDFYNYLFINNSHSHSYPATNTNTYTDTIDNHHITPLTPTNIPQFVDFYSGATMLNVHLC